MLNGVQSLRTCRPLCYIIRSWLILARPKDQGMYGYMCDHVMLARLLYVAYAGCSYPNLIVPVQYIKGHCWRDSQRPFSAVTRGASPVFPKNAPDSAHHYTYICPMNTWLTISVFLLHTALSTIWSKVVAVVHRRQPERNFMRTSQVRCKSLGASPCHNSRACGATVARSTPATGVHRKVVGSNPAGLIEEAISFYSLFCSFRFFSSSQRFQ